MPQKKTFEVYEFAGNFTNNVTITGTGDFYGIIAIKLNASPTTQTVYFRPTNLWNADNARFAVYYWDASNTGWADMTRVSECEEVYMAQIPANYTNIIFCRMNPSSVGNNFDNGTVWNRTEDLTIGNSNLYELTEDNNNWSTGSWKTYTSIECINRWYVSGDFNNFDLTHPFTDNQVAITLAANTTYQFKIQHQVGNTYTWFGNPGTMTSTNCTDWNFGSLGQDDTNAKITTTIAGTYLFTMSVNTNGTPKLTVTYPALHTIKYDANMPTAWGKVVPFSAADIPSETASVGYGASYTLSANTPAIVEAKRRNLCYLYLCRVEHAGRWERDNLLGRQHHTECIGRYNALRTMDTARVQHHLLR